MAHKRYATLEFLPGLNFTLGWLTKCMLAWLLPPLNVLLMKEPFQQSHTYCDRDPPEGNI